MGFKIKTVGKQTKEVRAWAAKASKQFREYFEKNDVGKTMTEIRAQIGVDEFLYGKSVWKREENGVQFFKPDGSKGKFYKWVK